MRPALTNASFPAAPLLPLAGPASGSPDVTDVDGVVELELPATVLVVPVVGMLDPATDNEVDDPET